MDVRHLYAFVAACGTATTTTGIPEPKVAAVSTDGAFAVPGLKELEHKPILVLEDGDAWAGSPESLPAVTIYEDGLVITSSWGKERVSITTGMLDAPAERARKIYVALTDLPPRITISRASDQPEVAISARVGDAWRAVNVVGFRANPRPLPPELAEHFKTDDPPLAWLHAYDELVNLELRDRHAYEPVDFVVTMNDDSVPSVAAVPWPSGVPAPPSNLVPDESYMGRPRVYHLAGTAGATLKALARERKGYGVVAPSGERVSLSVHATIPAGDYLEMLMYCRRWEREPYHECDRKLPGR